jgi:hypothetical protein
MENDSDLKLILKDIIKEILIDMKLSTVNEEISTSTMGSYSEPGMLYKSTKNKIPKVKRRKK